MINISSETFIIFYKTVHLLLLANRSLKLPEYFEYEICLCEGQVGVDTKKFQNYFIHINVHLHTCKGLTVKVMRHKVIQNINNNYLPKDPECVSFTMIYHIFVSL